MNDKPEVKPPAYMTGPGGQKPIPVKVLRMRTGITVELPKKAACTVIADDSMRLNHDGTIAAEQINVPRYKINFLPWLGCYAVDFYNAGETIATGQATMIPREWCSWNPG